MKMSLTLFRGCLFYKQILFACAFLHLATQTFISGVVFSRVRLKQIISSRKFESLRKHIHAKSTTNQCVDLITQAD